MHKSVSIPNWFDVTGSILTVPILLSTSIRKVKFKTKKNNQASGCSLNSNKFFFGNISQIVNIFSCVIITVIALSNKKVPGA